MKILAGAGEKADTLLQSQLPKIRALFASKVGPALASAVKDDEKMRSASVAVYTLLPAVVRFAVGQEAFVKFCLAQRDKLILPAAPTAVPETSTVSIPPLAAASRFYAFVGNEVKGP